eukprot:4073865-Karenia_brevis.AAC.1
MQVGSSYHEQPCTPVPFDIFEDQPALVDAEVSTDITIHACSENRFFVVNANGFAAPVGGDAAAGLGRREHVVGLLPHPKDGEHSVGLLPHRAVAKRSVGLLPHSQETPAHGEHSVGLLPHQA